jgi:hypothetical protein
MQMSSDQITLGLNPMTIGSALYSASSSSRNLAEIRIVAGDGHPSLVTATLTPRVSEDISCARRSASMKRMRSTVMTLPGDHLPRTVDRARWRARSGLIRPLIGDDSMPMRIQVVIRRREAGGDRASRCSRSRRGQVSGRACALPLGAPGRAALVDATYARAPVLAYFWVFGS